MKNIALTLSFLLFISSPLHASTLQSEFAKNNSLAVQSVRVLEAWNIINASKRIVMPITVAVIDSGVSLYHPLLLPQLSFNTLEISGNDWDDDFNGIKDDVSGYDFVNNRPFMTDDNGHGTHVAGIIAAINPQAKILPIKVLNAEGGGSVDHVQKAIRYAVSRGSRVINLSLGALDLFESNKEAYEESIRYARERGVLVVAAAGNDTNNNDDVSFYPGNTWEDNLVSICATNNQYQLADFSNYGAWKVHLCAPGTEVWSLSNNFQQFLWARQQGTSQAAPYVSGAASILFGIKPSLQPYEVRNILMSTVDQYLQLNGTSQAGGVLNIEKAVVQLLQGQ